MSSARNHIDRRHFLASAGAAFLCGLPDRQAYALAHTDSVYASVYKALDGQFGVATISEGGEILHQYPLPARGHDVVFNPVAPQMVVFARRPGTFAAVIDARNETAPHIITSAKGRHFYGHGCFARDGSYLYATENDYDGERGIIGIYNVQAGFERVGEFSSFGIGPHEMLLLPDSKTLVVANGGIKTHPDFPRAKLNLSTMRPNLSFIDVTTGHLIMQAALPHAEHKLSIRHLALLGDKVWFACQNEGNIQELQPLLGYASVNHGDLTLLALPNEHTLQLRGYIGSIASNVERDRIAITSPRGGLSIEIDASTGTPIRKKYQEEICGIAPRKDGFLATSGVGAIDDRRGPLLWDNHIAVK